GSILAGWVPDTGRYRPRRCAGAPFWAVGQIEIGYSAAICTFPLARVGRFEHDDDVFVGDEMHGQTLGPGSPHGGQLPVGGATHQYGVADGGVECDDVLHVREPGGPGEGDGEGGQVE